MLAARRGYQARHELDPAQPRTASPCFIETALRCALQSKPPKHAGGFERGCGGCRIERFGALEHFERAKKITAFSSFAGLGHQGAGPPSAVGHFTPSPATITS
jgi:hypothetical protein